MEYGANDHEQSQMGTTIKIEEEAAATSTLYIDSKIDLNHLKQDPGLVQSVKSEPTMLVKKEITENSNEAATMEHGASPSVKEELQTEITIKTEIVHIDSGIELSSLKPEPGLVHSVKREPALLVKEEILEDSSHDSCEQQCVHVTATPVGTGGVNETCSTSLDDLLNVKYETVDIDIGPTVLRHMDAHYTINQQNESAATEGNAMPGSGVKKGSAEDKWGDNKPTSQKRSAQTTTEVYYDDVHVKSLLGLHAHFEKVDIQKHLLLHQHCTSSSNDLKCDSTSHKTQLLSARSKLHQRNIRKAATTKGTVADPSNQTGNKGIKTKQKPFACDVCEKGYSSKAGLNLHKRSHSSVELKNNLVNYEFHTRKKHYLHDEKFSQSGDLTKNIEVYTGHKPFQCKICSAKFGQRGSLTMHMRVHTGEKPYECDACHAKFAQKGGLVSHKRVHTGEKPYECDACHAKFAQKSGLTSHKRVHTGEKPYECDACHLKFAEKGSLTKHKRVHTGEKPYECDACNTKFVESSHLTRHMKVHTGEKPFECDMCHVKFAQRSNLTTHMRIHTGEKPYECDECHTKFAQKSTLTTHMRVHTVHESSNTPTREHSVTDDGVVLCIY